MRTDEEILARIEEIKERDFFGWETTDLIDVLPFDKVKPFLKEGILEKDWHPLLRDRNSVITRMQDYMPFAWEKANNCRGISAGRSMCHYSAWIWLIGDDLGDLYDYNYYGKDKLVAICDKYGWDSKQWDNYIRATDEDDDYHQRKVRGDYEPTN